MSLDLLPTPCTLQFLEKNDLRTSLLFPCLLIWRLSFRRHPLYTGVGTSQVHRRLTSSKGCSSTVDRMYFWLQGYWGTVKRRGMGAMVLDWGYVCITMEGGEDSSLIILFDQPITFTKFVYMFRWLYVPSQDSLFLTLDGIRFSVLDSDKKRRPNIGRPTTVSQEYGRAPLFCKTSRRETDIPRGEDYILETSSLEFPLTPQGPWTDGSSWRWDGG